MKLEADSDVWRGPLNRARARCCLVAGSAGSVLLEPALERGDNSALDGEEAEEAKEYLRRAIDLIEKSIGSSGASGAMDDGEKEEMQKWLLEALVTLANLTKDPSEREALYEKARVEGEKHHIDLDLEMEDVAEDEEDEAMDAT